MQTVHEQDIEARRQTAQVELDNLKSAAERNRWGQFATPFELALTLARYAHGILGDNPVRFLDPAIGTGAFFSALSQTVSLHAIETAKGIELDANVLKAAEYLWGKTNLQLVHGDFTRQEPPNERFNLVLTNPPYVRHHHLNSLEKERLRARLGQSLQLQISGLAGLYCYFLLLCHEWMEEKGLALWLIPSEFMDVNYGAAIRRYLTDRVTLLHIHRFCPTDVQFTDALVSSAVVVFRKSPPPAEHKVRLSFSGSIERPREEEFVPIDALRLSRKWTRFPGCRLSLDKPDITLGDIFSIKRGLATGSNSFFILSRQQAEEWEIPSQFLKPILPGPRYVTADVIDAHPNGDPDISPRVYLLDCDESEEAIKAHWPRFYEYLRKGREEKVADSYLANHRTPWYSQERRPPAPFLCTYMGRTRHGKQPFRFIWNRSEATARNVYLMLYPKNPLSVALKRHPELTERVFGALCRIAPSQLVSEGRVYGGGLHKVEPKELAQISAREILESVEGFVRLERQETLFA